jgi:AmmeMemoRadiSam system protein A
VLPTDAGSILLPIARAAIATALGHATPTSTQPAWLHEPGACFVTLTENGQLRGCIGSLQAHRSLLADVQANAVAAALRDPRFAPLTAAELEHTSIEVSVLTAPQPMVFVDEADALAQLRPGVDGVVFSCGHRRSTFLPQVWEQLPDRVQFMAQLKRKAGLDAHFWSDAVRLERYTVRQWTESPAPRGRVPCRP